MRIRVQKLSLRGGGRKDLIRKILDVCVRVMAQVTVGQAGRKGLTGEILHPAGAPKP